MLTLDKMERLADRVERHPWTTRLSVMQAMRPLKKHFHDEWAPEGWWFEDFLAFARSFFEIGQEQADKAGHMAHLRERPTSILLMASMHFQDAYNYELARVQRCVVLYAASDGGLYPFCTWNSGPCHRFRIEQELAVASHSGRDEGSEHGHLAGNAEEVRCTLKPQS